MVNEQIQPAAFNVSIFKPIIKDTNKSSEEISNTRPVAISDALQNLLIKFN